MHEATGIIPQRVEAGLQAPGLLTCQPGLLGTAPGAASQAWAAVLHGTEADGQTSVILYQPPEVLFQVPGVLRQAPQALSPPPECYCQAQEALPNGLMHGHQALSLMAASTGLASQSAGPHLGALLSSTAPGRQGQVQGQNHHPGALQSSAGPP